MTRQLLRARRVIDGAGGVIDHGVVLVADAQIEAVGRSVDVGQPSDAQVVDLGDSTVLPGLIDVHNHVTFSGDARVLQQVMAHDQDAMLAQGRLTAASLLAGGITTVRDLGALGDTLFRLAREIAAGQTVGPHIVASTAQLTAVGGPNSPLGGGCTDLAAARDRIDADAEEGARVVKIIATGSVTDTASDPTQPDFETQPSQASSSTLTAGVCRWPPMRTDRRGSPRRRAAVWTRSSTPASPPVFKPSTPGWTHLLPVPRNRD